MADVSQLKLVVVGDPVGKTCLLTVFATDEFPNVYVPRVFDYQTSRLEVDGQHCMLGLWDTVEQDGYDRLRPLSYPQTDVFLLCFSLVDFCSYENVEYKWYPELSHHCPDVPIILVGTKLDLRDDKEQVERPHVQSVSMQDGIKMQCKNRNIIKYMECSALTKYGVKEVFDEAVRTALKFQSSTQTQQNNKCCIL